MKTHDKERLVEQTVTYTLEMDGQLYVIENVPARVNAETGEQLFAPETVSRLQQIVRGQAKPVRVIETPVYDFAA
ncbi:MAG: YgiT-type zinc finger protein [Planctomycetes bacterium]|nr:YgiT-type zinc finger protein [Planctomycetota bacterium]